MTDYQHAIVWIDHLEAKIFQFDTTEVDKQLVHTRASGHHLHHKANTTGSGHLGVDKEFFGRVVDALTHTGRVLVVGPGNARTELKHHIDQHNPQLAKRISAVEPLDHPSDAALVALARKFFKADDRMH